MPINIGPENAQFNTQIPALDENANIQTALRYYHYGENFSGVGTLREESIAGYLKRLEDNKIEKTPTIIPANANLDNYTESGYYSQNTNAKAQSGSNYPIVPPNAPPGLGFRYAGLLRVFNDGFNVYQEYQVAGIPTNPTFWRAFFGNLEWTQWQTFAVDGHIHDDRYYTKQQSDNRYFPAINQLTVKEINPSSSTVSPRFVNNDYVLVAADGPSATGRSVLLLANNLSTPNRIIVPTDASVAFVVGIQITIMQKNTGQTTIVGAPGVTVHSTPTNRLRARWSSASLVKINTNEWVLVGDMA